MKTTILLILMVLPAMTSYGIPPLEPGDKVPDFEAFDDQGKVWKLSDQRSDYLVVYFYPAAFGGRCTQQACSYRDNHTQFALLNTQVIGISGDKKENLAQFREQNDLKFTLLSDENGNIARLFGVPLKDGGTVDMEVDGNQLSLTRGVTADRWTFVIDVNGKLIYKNRNVDAEEDSKVVLEYISMYEKRRSCTNW
jgi:peroxiredoxin Q/BCP